MTVSKVASWGLTEEVMFFTADVVRCKRELALADISAGVKLNFGGGEMFFEDMLEQFS